MARCACADLVGLLEEGYDLRMAVNCSALNLSNPQMPAVVARILERTGLEPARLTVEVTENALMNSLGAAIRTLDAVRELGVKVSIDDFGSGYSSLTYRVSCRSIRSRSTVRSFGKLPSRLTTAPSPQRSSPWRTSWV